MKNSAHKLLAIFIGAFITSQAAVARPLIELYEWNFGKNLAPFVLPVKQGEDPHAAAQRYFKNLQSKPDLVELFQGQTPDVSGSTFKKLNKSDRTQKALLVANLPKDYGNDSKRVERFIDLLRSNKHQTYLLPMVADLGMSLEESRDLKNQISRDFGILVAMGGDDVEPHFYKSDNFHSKNTIPTRDAFEISLIQNYVASNRGFLLGVCRGAQISAVSMGYKLIQDIPTQKIQPEAHGNDWHDIEVLNTKHGILKGLAAKNANRLYVNSLHHQAILYKEGGPLELAATAIDKTTEALEFKNGRGLLLQFHPELMENKLGSDIFRQIMQFKQQRTAPYCKQLF